MSLNITNSNLSMSSLFLDGQNARSKKYINVSNSLFGQLKVTSGYSIKLTTCLFKDSHQLTATLINVEGCSFAYN